MLLNKKIGLAAFIAGMIGVSCNNVPNSPGWEYMPDMYRSSSYEANSGNGLFTDSMTNRRPATGTLSQGEWANSAYTALKTPYPYKFDSLGYELAGQNLRNPLPATDEIVAKGKDRYEKFCMHCHGSSGQGDGGVVNNGGFPPPPAYNSPQLKNMPEGKMYHSIHYGKGMMGSHASQLTSEERWQIIRYVQTLQNPGGDAQRGTPIAVADSGVKVNKTMPAMPASNDSTATKQ